MERAGDVQTLYDNTQALRKMSDEQLFVDLEARVDELHTRYQVRKAATFFSRKIGARKIGAKTKLSQKCLKRGSKNVFLTKSKKVFCCGVYFYLNSRNRQ